VAAFASGGWVAAFASICCRASPKLCWVVAADGTAVVAEGADAAVNAGATCATGAAVAVTCATGAAVTAGA